VDVRSFGTLEQWGAPALPSAVRAASAFGIDLSDHRARALGAGELEGTQLAVGFEPAHVAAAVSTGGVSADRAFLLAELADVLEVDVLPWPENSQELGARIAHADSRRFARGRMPRSIADPVGGSERRFQQTYEEIDRMVAIIATRLFRTDAAPTD
jgi:protein-tyrosine-phosphatase